MIGACGCTSGKTGLSNWKEVGWSVSGRLGVVSSGSGAGFETSRREVAAAEDVAGRGWDREGVAPARMLLQCEWAVPADGPGLQNRCLHQGVFGKNILILACKKLCFE
jgi:hypothetical protein